MDVGTGAQAAVKHLSMDVGRPKLMLPVILVVSESIAWVSDIKRVGVNRLIHILL